MPGQRHTRTFKGRMVRVVLKSGEVIIDNFEATKSRWVHLRSRKVRRSEITSLTIFTHQPQCKGA